MQSDLLNLQPDRGLRASVWSEPHALISDLPYIRECTYIESIWRSNDEPLSTHPRPFNLEKHSSSLIFLAFRYINGHERSTRREVQISKAMQMSLVNSYNLNADVTESKFHRALPFSLPLQCLLSHRLGCPGAVGPHTQHQACCG